ncbi:ABC transporter permease [Alloscardovia macacae]|uniref:Peptide ABC transporter permease n=1 Tax=Alloscardovia macacae TaxID=1160091 RepID=A0A1Y2SVX0_9BIFI|nr:ABC transporter permease [Alloscardovia macacae]OTA26382.1 peptide ABC transporter permease [Alloscardovia macacae]OTA28812.1 peptide ABC transporter permease [Alloscardovia macacae]OZG53131.1 peptide ABC transporter permease [Alloscardovia macacae]
MTSPNTPLPGQERYVAPVEETPLHAVDAIDENAPATSMWADAWRTLRKNPLFIISALVILFIAFVALFPRIFTSVDPNYCTLDYSRNLPSAGHPFGYDMQGCDIYSRVIYGTRTSLTVGIATTLLVIIFGGLIGAIAGYFGGWVDALLSRLVDIFYAVPLLLGAIVVLQMFRTSTSIWKIVLVMAMFGWVSIARIARSSVLEAKNLEFNTASTALGSTPARNLFRHIIPNALAPVLVVGTTSLASYIVLEATLSFLGLGMPSGTVSWGGDISSAQTMLRTQPMILFYPSVALAITALAFIMLGDAVRDALDPKSRTE